jgi:ribulose kinase
VQTRTDHSNVDEKKFVQLRDLVFSTLHDADLNVRSVAKKTLLPVFVQWAEHERFVFPKLFHFLLDRINLIVNVLSFFDFSSFVIEIISTSRQRRICTDTTFTYFHGLEFGKFQTTNQSRDNRSEKYQRSRTLLFNSSFSLSSSL